MSTGHHVCLRCVDQGRGQNNRGQLKELKNQSEFDIQVYEQVSEAL